MKPLLDSVFAYSEQSFESPEIALDIKPAHVDLFDVLSLMTDSLSQGAEDSEDFHQQLRQEGRQLGQVARDGVEQSPAVELQVLLNSAAVTIERLVYQKEIRDKQRIQELAEQIDALRAELLEVRQRSQTDSLTGVLNRGAFDILIGDLTDRYRSEPGGFALLLFDIDDFKKINDSHGHQVGDEALRIFTQRCRSHLRPSDRLARYGGEEFAVVMESVSLEHATARAERICRALADTSCKVGHNGSTRHLAITASAGVSSFVGNENADDVIRRADEALYLAKSRGKNCALCEHDLLH